MAQIDRLEPRLLLTATNLDSSFGDAGIAHAIAAAYDHGDGAPRLLTRDPSGKYVTASPADGGGLILARFNADGTWDRTLPPHNLFEDFDLIARQPSDIAVDPISKDIVLPAGPQLIFLKSDGTPDTTRGNNGLVDIGDFLTTDRIISRLAYQADGSLLLAGTLDRVGFEYPVFVAKLKNNLAFDKSFGHNGLIQTSINTEGPHDLQEPDITLKVAPRGAIYLFGDNVFREDDNGLPGRIVKVRPQIVRLTPTGAFDTSFSGDGIVDLPGNGRGLFSIGLALAPDGSISVASYDTSGGTERHATLRRLSAAGEFLTEYGETGRVIEVQSADSGLSSVAVDSHNRTYFMNSFALDGFPSQNVGEAIRVTRFTADLHPDKSWADLGRSQTDATFDMMLSPPIVTNDDRVVLGVGSEQTSDQDLGLLRFLAGGDAINTESATAKLMPSGTIDVAGSSKNDQIHVSRAGGSLIVQINQKTFTFDITKVGGVYVHGEAGNDAIWIGNGIEHTYVQGGAGDDSISGSDRDDNLSGGAGKDRIDGNGGNDRIRGNNGSDTLRGGDGNDTLGGGAGDDRMYGELGEDSLNGNTGRDTIDGGPAHDVLSGQSDIDTLNTIGDVDGFGLDQSFGNGGVALPDLPTTAVPALLPLADGKIAMRWDSSPDSDHATYSIERLNSDGSLDKSFGDNGLVTRSGAVPRMYRNQATGDLLLISPDPSGPLLTFLRPDGKLDQTIGTHGVVRLALADISYTLARFTTDGKIVLAGSGDSGAAIDYFVARLNADGTLDKTFGTNGVTIHAPLADNIGVSPWVLRVATDNTIYLLNESFEHVSETYEDDNGVTEHDDYEVNDSFVEKYQADGTLDATFGDQGTLRLLNNTDEGVVSVGMFLRSDGSLTVINVADNATGDNTDYYLFHVLPTGALDPATGGETGLDIGESKAQLAFAKDGSFITDLLLDSTDPNQSLDAITVQRYDSNGKLDTSFAPSGSAITSYSFERDISTPIVADDGSVIIAGNVQFGGFSQPLKLALVRFGGTNASGSTQSAFIKTDGTLDVGGTSKGDEITLSRDGGKLHVVINGKAFDFDAANVTNVVVHSGAGNDSIKIKSSIDHVFVQAGSGNDTVSGGDGNESISGGDGNDSVSGGGGNDTITGDASADVVSGGSGNDSLSGGDGADTLSGDDGDDVLEPDGGRDKLDGGTGFDEAHASTDGSTLSPSNVEWQIP